MGAETEAAVGDVLGQVLAPRLRKAGVDPSKIRETFDHKDQATTDRYGGHVVNLADSLLLQSAATFAQAAEERGTETRR